MPNPSADTFGSFPRRYSQSPALDALVKKYLARRIGTDIQAAKSAAPVAVQGSAPVPALGCPVADNHPSPTPSNATPSATPVTPTPTTPVGASSLPTNATATATPSASATKLLQSAVDKLPSLTGRTWRSLWQHERIIAGFEAATGPDAVAFSVNLSKARQKLLLNHAEPANLFSRYIARQLRQVLGGSVPYGFVFDVGVEGQLHAHGVIIPVGERQIDVAALKTCLARAGGKIGGKAASRQVQTTPLYDGRGWAAYSLRNYDTVCQHLGTHKGGFLSTDLIRLAKKAFA